MRSRRLRAAGALALAVGLAGCMTTAVLVGPEKTDLGQIGVGKSRPEVERVLGEPERRAGNVASYRIYTDTPSLAKGADSALEEAQATMWAAIGDAVMTMILVGQPVMIYDYLQRREDAQAMINVVYTPDDRVMGLSLESAQRDYVTWATAEDPRRELVVLCRAANGGYPPAQYAEAMRLHYGLFETAQDEARAYLWLRLAAFGGHPQAGIEALRMGRRLSPAERQAADDRYARFEPEPCPEPAG